MIQTILLLAVIVEQYFDQKTFAYLLDDVFSLFPSSGLYSRNLLLAQETHWFLFIFCNNDASARGIWLKVFVSIFDSLSFSFSDTLLYAPHFLSI